MLNFGPTFIWVIINFLILFFFLRLVLFKPVTKLLDQRTNKIRNDLDGAEKAKAEAARLKQEYEDKLRSAAEETENILNDARTRAQNEYEKIIAEARANSERLLGKAHEQIESERQEMVREVRNQVASLALSAASKVIEANMDTDANRKLVDKFIDEAGAA